MRNALAMLAVAAVFLLSLIELEPSHAYAEIHCGAEETPEATLPSMEACMAEASRVNAWRYCTCLSPDRQIVTAWYHFVIPMLLLVAAVFTIRGKILVQLVQFAAAAALGTLATNLLFPFTQEIPDEEDRLFFMIYSCSLAVTGFMLFALVRGAAAGIRAWRARTAKLAST